MVGWELGLDVFGAVNEIRHVGEGVFWGDIRCHLKDGGGDLGDLRSKERWIMMMIIMMMGNRDKGSGKAETKKVREKRRHGLRYLIGAHRPAPTRSIPLFLGLFVALYFRSLQVIEHEKQRSHILSLGCFIAPRTPTMIKPFFIPQNLRPHHPLFATAVS